MKQYIHDYTLPSEAESKLFDALMECEDKNSKVAILIDQARMQLQKYLAKDNIIEDPNAEGFIKSEDYFDEDDLRKIREVLFRAIMTEVNVDDDEANNLVEIVDVIQKMLGEEPFGEINGFVCRQSWERNIENIEELPEVDDVVLKNEHYGHILNALYESLQQGWKDEDEDEILDTINVCIRNYNGNPDAGYGEIEDFLYEWEI